MTLKKKAKFKDFLEKIAERHAITHNDKLMVRFTGEKMETEQSIANEEEFSNFIYSIGRTLQSNFLKEKTNPSVEIDLNKHDIDEIKIETNDLSIAVFNLIVEVINKKSKITDLKISNSCEGFFLIFFIFLISLFFF